MENNLYISHKLTEENKKALYSMKLHETKVFSCEYNIYLMVTRVPGGWIYEYNAERLHYAIFIPFDNEFQ
jgi:hypothetical protein